MPDRTTGLYFELFNEIGILEQLSRSLFEARMPAGMLVSHFAVLNHLIRVQDGRTPLELARAFQVAKSTMSHTLGGLDKAGFVETRPNPEDKRSKCIWITATGRAFREQAIAALAPDIADLSQAFAPEQVQAALPHLQALRRIMDARRDAELHPVLREPSVRR